MQHAVLPASIFQALSKDLLANVLRRQALKLGYHRHDTLLQVLLACHNYKQLYTLVMTQEMVRYSLAYNVRRSRHAHLIMNPLFSRSLIVFITVQLYKCIQCCQK